MHHPSASAERLAGLNQNIVKVPCFALPRARYSSGFIRRAVLFIHQLGIRPRMPRRVPGTGLQGAQGLRFEYLKGAGF
jgi:hypothetical protein